MYALYQVVVRGRDGWRKRIIEKAEQSPICVEGGMKSLMGAVD